MVDWDMNELVMQLRENQLLREQLEEYGVFVTIQDENNLEEDEEAEDEEAEDEGSLKKTASQEEHELLQEVHEIELYKDDDDDDDDGDDDLRTPEMSGGGAGGAFGGQMRTATEMSPLPATPEMPAFESLSLTHMHAHAATGSTTPDAAGATAREVDELLTPVMSEAPTTVKKKEKERRSEEDAETQIALSSVLPNAPGLPSPFKTPGVKLKKNFFGDGSPKRFNTTADIGAMRRAQCMSPLGDARNRQNVEASHTPSVSTGDDTVDAVARTLVMSAPRQNSVFKTATTRASSKSRFRLQSDVA